jgi:hypothetical protein
MASRLGTLAAAVLAFAARALFGRLLPDWFILVATLALAKGAVALGLVVLMRGGLVSSGQGGITPQRDPSRLSNIVVVARRSSTHIPTPTFPTV